MLDDELKVTANIKLSVSTQCDKFQANDKDA
jgi:hypothetical protein